MLNRFWLVVALASAVIAPVHAGSMRGDAEGLYLRGNWETVTRFRFNGPGEVSGESYGSSYLTASPLPDGQYSYEVWGYDGNVGASRAPAVAPEQDPKQQLDNGRGAGAREMASRAQPEVKLADGYFRIENGRVVVDNGEQEQ